MHIHDHISEKDKESPPLKFSYLNGILLLGNWLECFMDCFIKIQTAPSYYSSMSPTSDLTSNMHVRPGILIDMLESVQKFASRVCCEQWSAIYSTLCSSLICCRCCSLPGER